MKKRAVLFLLVLCAVLCLALPAMAEEEVYISTSTPSEQKEEKYQDANDNNKTIIMKDHMYNVDMTQDIWQLRTKMKIAENIIFRPTGLTIQATGVLCVGDGLFPRFDCPITNYGTIESGTYTGTIINYGTITGGTFTGTVKNEGTGIVTGGDFSQANMVGSDESFAGAYITVTLKLNIDEHITGERTRKILRGSSIWTEKPTRDGDPATTSTVFAYWRKDGSTGTDDIYAHDYFNAPDSQITVTPVWCDHLVQFDVNVPEGNVLLNDRMLPMAFYKNEGKDLPEKTFVWVTLDKDGNVNKDKSFLCWNTRADGKGLNYRVRRTN